MYKIVNAEYTFILITLALRLCSTFLPHFRFQRTKAQTNAITYESSNLPITSKAKQSKVAGTPLQPTLRRNIWSPRTRIGHIVSISNKLKALEEERQHLMKNNRFARKTLIYVFPVFLRLTQICKKSKKTNKTQTLKQKASKNKENTQVG